MKKVTISKILEIGTQLIGAKGFNNVGLNEILSTADIPKGSFYYYFKSKEDFGLQVIRYYSQESIVLLKSYLEDTRYSPKERFMRFFKDMRMAYQQKAYTEGCLLGNCSLELGDIKGSYAQTINKELEEWQLIFEKCIQEGQKDQSIKNEMPAKKLAAFLLNNWEGALLRMKSAKSGEALDIFIEMTEEILF